MPQMNQSLNQITTTCTDVTIEENGNLTFWFGSEGFSVGNLESVYNYINNFQNIDNARMLLIGWWLSRNPDATNKALVVGKTLILDLSSPNPIKVQ